MARTGRPKKEIDKHQFEVACGLHCTEQDMCALFECCEDTLNSWCKQNYKDEDGKPMTFSDVYKQKKVLGKLSLRRNQFKLSEKSATMAIWLGKQYLGQSDTVSVGLHDDNDREDDPLTKALKEEAERLENENKTKEE